MLSSTKSDMSESEVAISLWKRQEELRNSFKSTSTTNTLTANLTNSDDIIEVNFENDFQFPCLTNNAGMNSNHSSNHRREQLRQQSTLLWRYGGSNNYINDDDDDGDDGDNHHENSNNRNDNNISNNNHNNNININNNSNNNNNNNNRTGISNITNTTISSSSPHNSVCFPTHQQNRYSDISNVNKKQMKIIKDNRLRKTNFLVQHRQQENNNKYRRISEPVIHNNKFNQKRKRKQYHCRKNSSTPRGSSGISCLKPTTSSTSTLVKLNEGEEEQDEEEDEEGNDNNKNKQIMKMIPSTSSDTPWGLRDNGKIRDENKDTFAKNSNIYEYYSNNKICNGDRRTSSILTSSNSKVITKFTSFIRRVFRRNQQQQQQHRIIYNDDDGKISEISNEDDVMEEHEKDNINDTKNEDENSCDYEYSNDYIRPKDIHHSYRHKKLYDG